MGLDMYLYLEKYESNCSWENNKKKVEEFYPQELKDLGERIFERNFMSKETSYQVAYWRKANAIHEFFLNGEEDKCQKIYVSIDRLQELVDLCKSVIANPSLAEHDLPTKKGFFFGSQEYDEGYFQDLKDTIEQVEPIIEFFKDEHSENYVCYYRASW